MALLDLSKHVQSLQTRDPEAAAAFRLVEDAINHLGKNSGSHPIGEPSPPANIQKLNIKTSGELVHATIQDNAAISRPANYFLEYEHLGTSRGRVLQLPSNSDSGAAQTYYFRAYSQLPGSKASTPINFGSEHTPTPVQMSGSTNMSLLPSTGSGTADPNGQQGGQGFGKFLTRPAVAPKRSVRT